MLSPFCTPLVEEVREHLQEMLDGGRPSPLGVTQWFWCVKKMGVSGSVSISAG